MRHGNGVMTWYTKDGEATYEGIWENDIKEGNGKYTWPNKTAYNGKWVQAKRNG